MSCVIRLAVAVVVMASCGGSSAPGGRKAIGSKAQSADIHYNYQLNCAASNTLEMGRIFCMRLDTRSGDVRRVHIEGLSIISARSNLPDHVMGASYRIRKPNTVYFVLRI